MFSGNLINDLIRTVERVETRSQKQQEPQLVHWSTLMGDELVRLADYNRVGAA